MTTVILGKDGLALRNSSGLAASLAEMSTRDVSNDRPTLQRILVVDDEPNVALFLQAALEHLPDCEVEIATSGEQALRLSEQQPFDLLITDYKMPGMDGIVLAAKVREIRPQTVILIITAFADDKLYQAIAGADIRRVVHKPVKTGEIRALAFQALGRTLDR